MLVRPVILMMFAFTLALLAGCGSTPPDWRAWLVQNEVDADAHWIDQTSVLMPESSETAIIVAILDEGVVSVPLQLDTTEDACVAREQWPHLADQACYRVDLPRDEIRRWIKHELYSVESSAEGVSDVSRIQMAGLIDALFTAQAADADEASDLGAQITADGIGFAVWAPTARQVSVKLYDADKRGSGTLLLTEEAATGIWRGVTPDADPRAYYRYEVEVFHPESGQVELLEATDPYSLSLSTDSQFSQIVDLDADDTKPQGWDGHIAPKVRVPEAQILYELHIGDFSGTDDSIPDLSLRGKYAAFLLDESDGLAHLQRLRDAGMTTIHFLPTYDLGSIPETPEGSISMHDSVADACHLVPDAAFCETADPSLSMLDLLDSFDPQTGDAQAVIEAIDEIDNYNWGYDPYHYTVPEGSYALSPDGVSRLVEFRAMVQRLHEMGFQVVMDVVYNHTFQAGLSEKSVLDKIVPDYYHRRHPVTGDIEQSTCCENTATEHVMMAKLMTDSLVVWARDYRIDGFRFDLMGHQPKQAMLDAREAIRALSIDTYFYGEGWNFGEVAGNARFVQATQAEMAGTEIGTFSDRLRDAVRGGSSFVDDDALRVGQGLGNGLVTLPNELQTDEAVAVDTYRLYADQVRIGLAGNLATFPLVDRTGADVTGADIPYGDSPTGYALDPADTINYVSKHDNQTLWDNNQYRIAHTASADTRARMQVVSLSYVMYAQGIPFVHMGSEMLRSKSFLRDSFNYSHWFNAVDFSGQGINDDAGLPPAAKDAANWDLILRLQMQNEGRDRVGASDITYATNAFLDMVKVRSGSPLFSLTSAEDVSERVSFHNTGADAVTGLIVMSIDDGAINMDLPDIDPAISRIVIVFNHGPDPGLFTVAQSDALQLHPILAAGADPILRTASVGPEGLSVPGWTTAVFVQSQ